MIKTLASVVFLATLLGCQSTINTTVLANVEVGFFKANVERLAIEYNLTPVIWDSAIKGCDWQQKTMYQIAAKTPEDAIASYVQSLDFTLEISTIDRHMKVMYIGPKERLSVCHA